MGFDQWYVAAMREWERRGYGYVSGPHATLNRLWRYWYGLGFTPDQAVTSFNVVATNR